MKTDWTMEVKPEIKWEGLEETCTCLAAQMRASQDNLIANVVTLAIGDGWTLASLAERMLRKVFPGGVEIISLDGSDILELHPARFEQTTEGESIKIKAVQSYRILCPDRGVYNIDRGGEQNMCLQTVMELDARIGIIEQRLKWVDGDLAAINGVLKKQSIV